MGTEEHSFRVGFSLQGIPVVKKFVSRNAEMAQLTQALLPTSTEQMRRKVFVLHGLGGIGKTQLSTEFARKNQESYSAVFWTDGSSKERLKRSIANLTSRMPQHHLPERSRNYSQNGSANLDEVVKDVLDWLSRPANDQWLLIIDNVDREVSDSKGFDVKKFFPTADHGSILITSRLASLQQLGTDIKLEPVDDAQGASILENSLGQSTEGECNWQQIVRTVSNAWGKLGSLELVKLLQGLPLAINQAGSYMRTTGTNVSEYIELYDQVWARLMEKQHLSTLQENADRSILTTWTLSLNSLRSKSEHAANLLMLWAFLDHRDLWYELLRPTLDRKIANEVPRWFARCAGDRLEFKESMGLLLEYSFIDAKTESSSFSMHPVLHHWCFHTLEEDKATLSWLGLIVVGSAAPERTVRYSPLIQRRLLPHCDRVYSMMELLFQEALKNRKHLPSFSNACNQLGILYRNQGKMKEAENMYLHALIGKENAWGPEHTETLDTVNNLGVLYRSQGKIKEAEVMYQRALAGYEKAWGPHHIKALETRYNLGNLYKKWLMFEKAVQHFELVVQGYTRLLGPEHDETVDALDELEGCKSRLEEEREGS